MNINFLKTNNSKFKYSNKYSLKNNSIVKALENLHKNFIVAPVDKANGNIAFICKGFYAKRLLKEHPTNNTSKTCTVVKNMYMMQ